MTPEGRRQRKRGSVRFDEYFKAQWWDARSLAWRDVQVNHPSIAAATGSFTLRLASRWRVMRVTMAGREPVPGAEVDL